MIQETKKLDITQRCLSSIWGIRNIESISCQAEGTAGGNVDRMEDRIFDVNQIEYGVFSLYVRLRKKQDGLQWLLSCIYGPTVHLNKEDFWIELDDLGNLIEGPWCVGGDFNEILYAMDRKGSTIVNAQSEQLHRWVSDFSLIDIPLTNLRHTWSNFQLNASFNKIDRIFVSKE